MFVVAGVTGKVGSVVAKELLAAGQPVRVIVRDAKRGAEWESRGAGVAVGSLDDQAFLTGALNGASGFFTLLPPDYGASDLYEVQARVITATAGAVNDSGVPRVVMLSSVGADLAEGNGPIKGLYKLENALRATGTRLTAIRAAYFQENVANALRPARQSGVFPVFSLTADYPLPMVATRDIGARAALSLQEVPAANETIFLGGPAYSMRQVAELLGVALERELQVVLVPQGDWAGALLAAGMTPSWANALAEMYGGFASGLIRPNADHFEEGATRIEHTLQALLR